MGQLICLDLVFHFSKCFAAILPRSPVDFHKSFKQFQVNIFLLPLCFGGRFDGIAGKSIGVCTFLSKAFNDTFQLLMVNNLLTP